MKYMGKTMRHELKYYINYEEYTYLRNRIRTVLSMDENSIEDVGYHIRSLYFDDIYNSALEEKQSGIMLRKKYRVRIYNKEDKTINLECKEKYGEYISKSSSRLTKEQFYKLMHGQDIGFLLDMPKQVCKDMYVNMKTKLLKPAVTVDYEREPYVLEEGNVRITFDKNIQAGINTPDIFSEDMVCTNVLPPNIMVLEVKFDDYMPKFVNKLIQIQSHNRSAISKYVLCRLHQFNINPVTQSIYNNWAQNI